MNPLIHLKKAPPPFLIPLALALGWLALSPTARAVDPPPDGGYPNFNTAEGDDALLSLTTGHDNTANGSNALYFNTTGSANTANGSNALYSNTTGPGNTATGIDALYTNTTGFYNTANGFNALFSNTTGNSNTAVGGDALYNNTTGFWNTAIGFDALPNNTTGDSNTAIGVDALLNNTTGSGNIAVGNQAGALLTGGIENIDIGNRGVGGESKTIRIGTKGVHRATLIAGISGATAPTGVTVIVEANGHLGTTTSSARYKEAIQPMKQASEAILALEPVTFRYKHELDPEGIPQFGLVAEQVEKVNPDLVARDDQGKPYTVRYDAVNAMSLNEFLKEHRTVGALQASFAQQQKDFQATAAHQQKEIEALTAGLQKVSAQVEVSKAAPQTVLNNQ